MQNIKTQMMRPQQSFLIDRNDSPLIGKKVRVMDLPNIDNYTLFTPFYYGSNMEI